MNGHSRQPHSSHTNHVPSRRHIQYRRSIVRRQRVVITLAVVGITLLILALLVLIVGTHLHKKSAALRETDTAAESVIPSPTTPITPSVLAYPWESLPSTATAASLTLNQPNGTLLCDAESVASVSSEAKARGIYLSGVFYLSAFRESDDLLRYTRLSEHCACVAELLRAGLDEVILVLPTDTVQAEELQEFLLDLRQLVPNAVVGLSLPHAFLTEENAAAIDALAQSFSLLALDLTQTEDVDAAIAGEKNYYLRRYAMRVLLPSGDSTDKKLGAVQAYGIENIQFIPSM